MWIFLVIVIALLLAVLLYPYISVAFCRKRAISQLRGKLRHVGGRMRVLRTFAFISSNRAPKYDLLAEKSGTLYAVKFWSAAHKNTDLRIYSDGKVGEERTHQSPMTPHGVRKDRTVRYYARAVTKTAYNFKIPQGKKVVNVLLMYPSYRAVYLERGGETKELHSGDLIFDKIILTPYAFGKLLSEEK